MGLALISLVGVIITAFVTWSIAQRRIAVENVTKERAKWRNQIRDLASQIYDAMLFQEHNEVQIEQLVTKLRVLLDPCDKRDQKILKNISEFLPEEFITEVTLMLKHDWERSKLEAGFFLCRWFLSVKRLEKCDIEKSKSKWCEKYKIKWCPLILMIAVIGTVIVLITVVCIELKFGFVSYWLSFGCECI